MTRERDMQDKTRKQENTKFIVTIIAFAGVVFLNLLLSDADVLTSVIISFVISFMFVPILRLIIFLIVKFLGMFGKSIRSFRLKNKEIRKVRKAAIICASMVLIVNFISVNVIADGVEVEVKPILSEEGDRIIEETLPERLAIVEESDTEQDEEFEVLSESEDLVLEESKIEVAEELTYEDFFIIEGVEYYFGVDYFFIPTSNPTTLWLEGQKYLEGIDLSILPDYTVKLYSSPYEYEVLIRTVRAEVLIDPWESHVAAAEVIRNRCESNQWQNTVLGVITAKGQFLGYGAKQYYINSEIETLHEPIAMAFLENSNYAFGVDGFYSESDMTEERKQEMLERPGTVAIYGATIYHSWN